MITLGVLFRYFKSVPKNKPKQSETNQSKPNKFNVTASNYRPAGTGQPGQDSRDRTAGTGQLGQDSRDRTAGTGQLERESRGRAAGEESQVT
jgi:hypothetical protein